MLTNTFHHLRGIGAETEHRLWEKGVHSWQMVAGGARLPLSSRMAEAVRRGVDESAGRLEAGDPNHFSSRLPASQHWRLFPEFRHSVAYLDIETTGMGGPGEYITAATIYDGTDIRTYVYDDNLNDFRNDIAAYKLIVTYNGKCFDVPFIRNYLGAPMPQAHIDLRYVLAALGYCGGLKGCEKQLGIDRDELDGVDGYFAVLLWADYLRNGNERALETLLAYNVMDVVNLEALMIAAYNLNVEQTPFSEERRLPAAAPPESPFKADVETVERIRRRIYR